MNLYGYWQYNDCIGLSCDIEKFDLVYVFKMRDDMAHAVNEKGRVISFHKTNITKEWFNRPSYQHHRKCSLGTHSKHIYTSWDAGSERHKNDCHLCQMYKFKQTVKRFKERQ